MEIPEGHEIMGMVLQQDLQDNITWVNFKTSLLTRTHDHEVNVKTGAVNYKNSSDWNKGNAKTRAELHQNQVNAKTSAKLHQVNNKTSAKQKKADANNTQISAKQKKADAKKTQIQYDSWKLLN